MSRAIQDQLTGNHCFGCGPENADGLRIKSYWQPDDTTTCRFKPSARHCAGPAAILNGGIIATLIDCHCVCTAMAHAYRLEGRRIGATPPIWFATGSMSIDYLAPARIDGPVDLVARVREFSERKSIVTCELNSGDEICARAEIIAVRVPAEWSRD